MLEPILKMAAATAQVFSDLGLGDVGLFRMCNLAIHATEIIKFDLKFDLNVSRYQQTKFGPNTSIRG